MHIPEETAERANNIDCERANPACICLWGESLFTHTKQKINSNIPGLIILKQIQPRTYGLEGFCICGLFSHHSFYLTLVENMIEQSRVIFSWPMICLKRPSLFCVCYFTMELWNYAWEKKNTSSHNQPFMSAPSYDLSSICPFTESQGAKLTLAKHKTRRLNLF